MKVIIQENYEKMSKWAAEHIITAINNNTSMDTNPMFVEVFTLAQEVSKETNGAFDITVAPLVNLWGFGFKNMDNVSQEKVDSLLPFVGYQKVKLVNGKIQKEHPETMLDCSAIAKGYAVDVVAQLLDRKGIQNYMVDIGGEVDVHGKNPNGELWRIGINKPTDDSLSVNQDLQTVLSISEVGIATSGNYRNYYYRDGKKYAHTIEPRTGYPVQHSILSATVVARDCMSADAYATSFMVIGLEEAEKFIQRHPDIDAYLIYTDDAGEYQTYVSEGMKAYIEN